jgi:hypothetical protein
VRSVRDDEDRPCQAGRVPKCHPNVRFGGNRIKHRMNEDRYSQFTADEQAGNEKTHEDNQDLQCHTTFLSRATSFWVLG